LGEGVIAVSARVQGRPISSQAHRAALQAGEVRAKLVVQGLYPVGRCGADFASYLRKEYDDNGRIVRVTNIKVE